MAVGYASIPWSGGWDMPRPRGSLRARWVDRRHYWVGRRDGTRCLPSLAPGASPPEQLRRIATTCSSLLERRWTELLVQTDEDRLTFSRLLPEIARAEVRRDLAATELERHRATKPGEGRRFGEEQVPADLVRRRRQREYDRATTALVGDRDRTRNYVAQLVQHRRELEARMSLQLEIAQSEARQQYRLFSRSASSYLRGAQRTHHDPESLLVQYRTFELPLPDWVGLDGLADFLRASGAESDDA